MASEATCPPPEVLDDLLANRLSAERAAEVRGHVGGCESCRQRLSGPPSPPAYPMLQAPRGGGEMGWLGDYRVVGVLGEGGMSVVYDAEEPQLNRNVALKVLKRQFNDTTTRERFLREGRLIASLPPEHVVHIYAVGEQDGVPYLAMERLRGESLATRLKRDRSLPVVEALKFAREAAEGLAALHKAGLVHRDIKPDNLWLELSEGRFIGLKLIDFGVARLMVGDSSLTLPGQVIGTPTYMAPEQAAGQPVDGRADLYSLGCVLYRMITGHTPFADSGPNTMAVLAAVIKGDAPDVRRVAPTLSPPVAELIESLMARDPGQRPANAAAVVDQLRGLEREENAASGKTLRIQAVPASSTRRSPRRVSPVGLWLGGAAIAAAVLVGALSIYFKVWSRVVENKPDAPVAFKGPPLKVGVLFSQSEVTAVHEMPLSDAVALAIEEINDKGGVLGRRVEPVVEDGASSERVFEEQAAKLCVEDEVAVIFGCWSSASRRRVAEVCRVNDRLLFFPAGGEGLDESAYVIHLGETPNQAVIPLIKYAYAELGKRRFFLLGAENIFSYSVAEILRHEIGKLGAEVVGTTFLPVGESELAAVARQIKEKKADFVIDTLDAAGSVSLLKSLRKEGLRPPEVATAWLSVSEPELSLFGTAALGDYSAACYFEGLDTPASHEFVERYRQRYGAQRRVSDSMQTAYAGVYLWKQAVEKAKATDTESVRLALRGMTVASPSGPLKIDRVNLHAWRTARVGKVARRDGRLSFEVVYQTPNPVEPEPFPGWKPKREWMVFLDKLHKGWGGAWEKHK